MRGVILAAGMAKRLRPLTDDRPKCLLSLGGKTLLERTVDAMCAAGVDSLLVVIGYRGEMIRDFISQHYPHLPVDYLDNTDYAHNNNIFSLWMAVDYLREETFLLMDSDIFCDPMAVRCVAQMPGNALALNRHELGEEEMKVVVNADNQITQISKTCAIADAVGESVGLIDVFYELAFERLIPKGHTFEVVDTTAYFSYELDTVEDFHLAQQMIETPKR